MNALIRRFDRLPASKQINWIDNLSPNKQINLWNAMEEEFGALGREADKFINSVSKRKRRKK